MTRAAIASLVGDELVYPPARAPARPRTSKAWPARRRAAAPARTPSPTTTEAPLASDLGRTYGRAYMRVPDDARDDDLLASSEPASFAIFYRRHVRDVIAYLMWATRDPDTAADLTAETFAAALVARRRYRPGEAPARAWLFGIAANKLADWRRRGYAEERARRRLGMQRIELDDDDRHDFLYLGNDVAVLQLIHELPPEQATAVRAHVLKERGYPEIAAELGVSEAVVRKRVSRGLATLRTRLGRAR
jgi:RNA polymerase sigma factor (sigma-70 family)